MLNLNICYPSSILVYFLISNFTYSLNLAQKNAVLNILNLKSPNDVQDSNGYDKSAQHDEFNLDEQFDINGIKVDKQLFCFKVLIIDIVAQKMLSTITKMTDIRECNVTSHSIITK